MSDQPPPPPSSGPPNRPDDDGPTGQGSPYGQPPPGPPQGQQPLPRPGQADSRTWAMGAHLSAFVAAWFAVAFVGPLVVWLVKRDEDPFVGEHAKEALNFNLTFLIVLVAGAIGGFLLTLVTLGLALIVIVPLAAIVVVGWIVLTIMAAVRANNGERYHYPFAIRFVS